MTSNFIAEVPKSIPRNIKIINTCYKHKYPNGRISKIRYGPIFQLSIFQPKSYKYISRQGNLSFWVYDFPLSFWMTILFVKITTYVAVKKSIHNEMNKTFFIFSSIPKL